MKKPNVLAAVVVVVVAVLALAFTYQYYPTNTTSPTPQRTVEINLVAKQWFFDAQIINSTDPNAKATTIPLPGSLANTTITVTKGDLVIIHFRTEDVAHGFALTGYPEVGPYEAAPGVTITFSFTASRAGTFIFHCTVFCGTGHPNHKGTLIVLP